MPILPTPTKPMVSMNVSLNASLLCHFDRLVGEVHPQAERTLHDRPFLEFERAQLVDEERIALGEGARLFGILGTENGQAKAARRTLAIRQRARGEYEPALF